MKKLCLVFLLLVLPNMDMRSQDFNITLQGGYVFDDSFDSYFDFNEFYEGTIEGGFQWGVGFEYFMLPEYGIELSYLRQDTNSPTTYFRRNDASIRFTDFDLAINYIMLGGNRYVSLSDTSIDGYIGLMAGMVLSSADNPDNGSSNDDVKFAWGVKLGAVYWFADAVGFKLQTNLISSVQAMGGGLYFGTGGAGAGLNSYSTIYQFGFTGGLVIKIDR